MMGPTWLLSLAAFTSSAAATIPHALEALRGTTIAVRGVPMSTSNQPVIFYVRPFGEVLQDAQEWRLGNLSCGSFDGHFEDGWMRFSSGATVGCPANKPRTARVRLQCAPAFVVASPVVTEDPICHYEMAIGVPEACSGSGSGEGGDGGGAAAGQQGLAVAAAEASSGADTVGTGGDRQRPPVAPPPPPLQPPPAGRSADGEAPRSGDHGGSTAGTAGAQPLRRVTVDRLHWRR